MPDPGDVVTVDFMGATGVKRRPAVVVSSERYHQHRPDLVLGRVCKLSGYNHKSVAAISHMAR